MPDEDNLIDPAGNVDEEELERRIQEMNLDKTTVLDEAKEKVVKIDEEFAARLKTLEEKADHHKRIRDNKAREVNRVQTSDRESAKGLGIGMSIAYTIIGLPLFGAGIGWILDNRAGTEFWKGICMLAGAILGIAMAFYTLSKQNNRP